MDRYELQGELGDGSFGRVMKATRKANGEEVSTPLYPATRALTTRAQGEQSL
jgi:hypothetical protein